MRTVKTVIGLGMLLLLLGCVHRPFTTQWPLPVQSAPNQIPALDQNPWGSTPAEDAQVILIGHELRIILPADKLFLGNSPQFRETAYPTLDSTLALLKNFPNKPIVIYGYTNDILPKHLADVLTLRRAETVEAYLWANGIPADDMQAKGCGGARCTAIASNKTIRGAAANRRIEIRVDLGGS